MRQKAWEEKHRLSSFRRRAKVPARSASEDNLSVRQDDADRHEYSQRRDTLQLAIDSPPQTLSPAYSRRQSMTSAGLARRQSGAGLSGLAAAPTTRHDRFRRRRSVSPMDPRDTVYRRSSPGRYDDEEPLMGYDDRVQSPTLFGVDNDLLDITPVPISRRQSFDRLRSPRLSLATSPRDQLSFFSETDPMPYLRHLSHQYSERRQSQTFPDGRPLSLPPERYAEEDAGDADSILSDDRETRF